MIPVLWPHTQTAWHVCPTLNSSMLTHCCFEHQQGGKVQGQVTMGQKGKDREDILVHVLLTSMGLIRCKTTIAGCWMNADWETAAMPTWFLSGGSFVMGLFERLLTLLISKLKSHQPGSHLTRSLQTGICQTIRPQSRRHQSMMLPNPALLNVLPPNWTLPEQGAATANTPKLTSPSPTDVKLEDTTEHSTAYMPWFQSQSLFCRLWSDEVQAMEDDKHPLFAENIPGFFIAIFNFVHKNVHTKLV